MMIVCHYFTQLTGRLCQHCIVYDVCAQYRLVDDAMQDQRHCS